MTTASADDVRDGADIQSASPVVVSVRQPGKPYVVESDFESVTIRVPPAGTLTDAQIDAKHRKLWDEAIAEYGDAHSVPVSVSEHIGRETAGDSREARGLDRVDGRLVNRCTRKYNYERTAAKFGIPTDQPGWQERVTRSLLDKLWTGDTQVEAEEGDQD